MQFTLQLQFIYIALLDFLYVTATWEEVKLKMMSSRYVFKIIPIVMQTGYCKISYNIHLQDVSFLALSLCVGALHPE